MKIPFKHKQIKSLFFNKFINLLVENCTLISKAFSLEIKKKIEANKAEIMLIKKQAFIPNESEIQPLKNDPKKTAKVFEATIIVDDLNLSSSKKKLEQYMLMATQPAAAIPVIVLPRKISFGLFDKNKHAEPRKETIPDITENNFLDFNLSDKYPIGILNNT